jgi:hypothetical protein
MDLRGILSSLLTAYYYCQRTHMRTNTKTGRGEKGIAFPEHHIYSSTSSCSALDHQMGGSYIFHQKNKRKQPPRKGYLSEVGYHCITVYEADTIVRTASKRTRRTSPRRPCGPMCSIFRTSHKSQCGNSPAIRWPDAMIPTPMREDGDIGYHREDGMIIMRNLHQPKTRS